MKTSCLFLYTTILLICVGCNDLSKKSEIDPSGFEYTIRGLVTNGEGLVFTLDIPENGAKLKGKVENGQFLIKGHEDQVQLARLGIEGSQFFGHILVEPAESTFEFEISGDAPDYNFGLPTVVQGERNKLFFKFGEELDSTSEEKAMIYSDSIKMDSMQRLVYPEYRREIFKLFDKYYAHFNSDLKLISLSFLTDRLNKLGPFDRKYLNQGEIIKIKNYFTQIDTSLSKYTSYQNVKTITSMLSSSDVRIEFHDYELEGIDGSTHKLSDIVHGNNYTIVDFWHRRCSPCRKFNLEMLPNYAKLKANRIEILGINVDKDKSDWHKCSSQDSVKWKNLHAGISTIEHMYNIRSFPTYIVFDKNLQLVDIDLKDASEVLDWASSVAKR